MHFPRSPFQTRPCNHFFAILLFVVLASGLLLVSTANALDPRLAAVNDWLYVLQPESPASITDIAASAFDLVVMDYSADGSSEGAFTPQEISALKATGKVVIAYLSIGEAEAGRFYWDPAWVDQQPNDPDAPAWLGPFNPDFPDNYKVRFWMADWQEIIFGIATGPTASYLDRIVDQGFDGVYLDIIDGFDFWSVDVPERSRDQTRVDMMTFVQGLAQYARVTRGISNFLVFPQNGSDIILDGGGILDAPGLAYLAVIDGIGVEDVFYDETTPQPPGEVDFRTNVLTSYLDAGGDQRVVISTDYVWNETAPTDSPNITRYDDYVSQAITAGYIPYATVLDRDLNEIVTADTADGFSVPQPRPGGGEVFTDGFESGNTAAWSLTVP
ncbi:MAG: endo alpha-1,4 polygalactosaminidase [Deltaproteobacteria bacterium]|nr:endo alpha-1,4 polygalactosaminidase [Deltaproteobacteria bacterium]